MNGGNEHIVQLRGALGLRDLAGLVDKLKEAIEANQAVRLAADELTQIDVCGLQVLVAAHKSAVRAGKTLQFTAPTAGALRQALVKAGFVSAGGTPLTPEGDFWIGPGASSKGMAA